MVPGCAESNLSGCLIEFLDFSSSYPFPFSYVVGCLLLYFISRFVAVACEPLVELRTSEIEFLALRTIAGDGVCTGEFVQVATA